MTIFLALINKKTQLPKAIEKTQDKLLKNLSLLDDINDYVIRTYKLEKVIVKK